MTKFILSALILISLKSFSQTSIFGNSFLNNRTEWYIQNMPTNTDGNRLVIGWIKGQQSFVMLQDTVRFKSLIGTGPSVVALNSNGSLFRQSKWSLIDTTFLATRSFSSATYQPLGSYVMTSDTSLMLSHYLRLSLFNWTSLPGKPPAFPPSAHTHSIIDVIGLHDSLNSRLKTTVATSTYEPKITSGTTGQYWRGDKTFQTLDKSAVELSNVDNTSDANKVVSTATQTALNAKQDALVSGTNLKTINGASLLGSGNVTTSSGTVTSVGASSSTLTVTPASTPVTSNGTLVVNLTSITTSGTYGAVVVDQYGRVTSGKRMEALSGSTNASGIYTVTYGTSYSTVPNVQFNIVGGSNKETVLLTSSTTTGFTVYVQLRSDVVGLLPSYSNVSGRTVNVLVTEM